MPGVTLNTKRRLLMVIRHFKFEELEVSVLPFFPEVSWNKIKKGLVKTHEAFSVKNVIRIIERAIDEYRIDEKILHERLSILQVVDVSIHHKRKTWYCHELRGSSEMETTFLTKRDIESKITRYFQMHQIRADVKTNWNDDIIFAGIKVKMNSKRSSDTPIFFALIMGQKHFFCSNQNVKSDYTKAIASTMGHDGSKRVKLRGKDLPSLVKLLWQKKQGAIDTNVNGVPYTDSPPIITDTGIDFTQSKNRKNYMDKCFGSEPPTLESLVLDSEDQTWKDELVFAELPNKRIFMEWVYASKNVVNYLKNLAERNVLVTPIPVYLSQWMTTGKNELTVQET